MLNLFAFDPADLIGFNLKEFIFFVVLVLVCSIVSYLFGLIRGKK